MSGAVANALDGKIIDFIGRTPSKDAGAAEFNRLAMEIFAYQFEYNAPYRSFCLLRRATPETIRSWEHIPPVPVSAFKSAALSCFAHQPGDPVFESSGTTRFMKSKHRFDSLNLYDASCRLNFSRHLLPDNARLPMRMLLPPPGEAPASSLVYMCDVVSRAFATSAEWFIRNDTLDHEALAADLNAACESGEPRFLLGTSFAFVHFFDAMAREKRRFKLPKDSRMMETGGYKGKSRECTREEFERMAESTLGLPANRIVNEYGMTELTSQLYDCSLSMDLAEDAPARHFKAPPPWMRVRLIDPHSEDWAPDGMTGIICIWDLANRGSVLAVLTEDLGVWTENGIRIIGRIRGAAPRGCALAADEALSKSSP